MSNIETITINRIETESILPRLRQLWGDYGSGQYSQIGRVNLVSTIGELGGRIIVELEALHAQVEQAEAENARLREKLQKVLADAVRPFPRQKK